LDDAVLPYSLRHTMARHMRKSGVSAWETTAQLGHKSREHRTTELYAPFDPDYLSAATVAIDSFFDSLLASYSPVPKPYFLPESPQITDSKEVIFIFYVVFYVAYGEGSLKVFKRVSVS